MAVAQIGPLTNLLEALAAAVGAGVVLGSFALGTYRLTRGGSREEIEARVLMDGYVGGFASIVFVALDIVVRYAF